MSLSKQKLQPASKQEVMTNPASFYDRVTSWKEEKVIGHFIKHQQKKKESEGLLVFKPNLVTKSKNRELLRAAKVREATKEVPV